MGRGLAIVVTCVVALSWAAELRGQSYVHRYHNLRWNTARPYGVAGSWRGGIPRPATSLYLRSPSLHRHYGYSRGRSIANVYTHRHSHLHHHYYRRPVYSPLSYTYRYHRLPSYYYSPYYSGRTLSGLYRRGPSSVSLYFRHLPYYRPNFYFHTWRSYPLGRTYFYDATLCYPYSYSRHRVYYGASTGATTAPSLLLPPPRITTGDSLLTSFASTSPPPSLSSLDRLEASLSEATSASIERLRMTRLTSSGDAYFAAGRYLEAVKSYTTAVEAAPLSGEGMFRLGHALVAAGEYETAARAFKGALTQTKNLGRDRFQLDDLYGLATVDKMRHLEALSNYALAKPRDADALFLVGLFLHYDGQTSRAHRFFDEAQRLDARSEHIRRMLDASKELIET